MNTKRDAREPEDHYQERRVEPRGRRQSRWPGMRANVNWHDTEFSLEREEAKPLEAQRIVEHAHKHTRTRRHIVHENAEKRKYKCKNQTKETEAERKKKAKEKEE